MAINNRKTSFNRSQFSKTAASFYQKDKENRQNAVALEQIHKSTGTPEYLISSQERKAYIAEHSKEIEKGISEMGDTEAMFTASRIAGVLTTGQSLYLFHKDEWGNNGSFPEDKRTDHMLEQAAKVYPDLRRGLFESLLDNNIDNARYILGGKAQNATLDWQHTVRGTAQTSESYLAALDNIDHNKINAKMNGIVMMYDTETTGGAMIQPKEGTDPVAQKITEINFTQVDLNDLDSKGVPKAVEGQSFNAIIGSTEEEDTYYRNLIARWNNKEDLSHDEEVTLDRLARMGKSTLDYSREGEGIMTYASFAGPDKIANFSVEDMEAGRKQLREVGKIQEANKVDYMGEKIFGYEKVFLDALHNIKDNGLTVAGHNVYPFDNPRLMKLAMNMGTEGGQRLMNQFLKENNNELFGPVIDTLAAERELVDTNKSLTEKDQKFADEKHLSNNQLELLAHHSAPDFYEDAGAAHSANTDSLANAIVLNTQRKMVRNYQVGGSDKPEDNDGFFRSSHFEDWLDTEGNPVHKFGRESKDAPRQLVIAKRNLHADSYNLFGFTTDPISGEMRTMDGFRINNRGQASKELFDQPGTQANVAYSIENIKHFELTDEFRDKIRNVFPNRDVKELHSITLKPVTSDPTIKGASTITYIGLKDDIQRALMDTVTYAGDEVTNKEKAEMLKSEGALESGNLAVTTDENGKKTYWTDIRMDERSRQTLTRHVHGTYTDEQGRERHYKEDFAYNVQSGIEVSTYRLKNESAARMSRSFNRKKDTQALHYLDARDKYVNEQLGLNADGSGTIDQDKVLAAYDNLPENIAKAKEEAASAEAGKKDARKVDREVIWKSRKNTVSMDKYGKYYLNDKRTTLKDIAFNLQWNKEDTKNYIDHANKRRREAAKEKEKAEEISFQEKLEAVKQHYSKRFDSEVEVASKAYEEKLRSGKSVSQKDLDGLEGHGTWQKYFGFKEWEKNKAASGYETNNGQPYSYNHQMVYSETVHSQMNRLEYIKKNKGLIQKAREYAEKRSSDPKEQDAYYYHYMTALFNKAQEVYGEHSKEAGFKNYGVYDFDKNTYEVSMDGFQGKAAKDQFLTFDLDNEGGYYGDMLKRFVGDTADDPDGIHRRKLLVDLYHHLVDNHMVSATFATDEENQIKETDSMHTASEKIQRILRHEREERPQSGRRKDTYHQQVLIMAQDNMGLSDELITQTLDGTNQTVPTMKRIYAPGESKYNEAEYAKRQAQRDKDIAKEIVDNYMFEDVSKETLVKQYKMSGENADALLRAHEIRRKDMTDFMTQFVTAARENDLSIYADKGRLGLVDKGREVTFDVSRETFSNGTFYTKIGGSNLLIPTGFYDIEDSNGKKELKFMSLHGKAANEVAKSENSMRYRLKRANENGTLLESAKRIFSQFNQRLRQASSANGMDMMDYANQYNMYYGDIFNHLPELWSKVNLDEDEKTAEDRVIDKYVAQVNAGTKKLDVNSVGFDLQIALDHRIDDLIDAAKDYAHISKKDESLFKYSSVEVKQSGKHMMASAKAKDFTAEYSNQSRGADEAISRGLKFRVDRAEAGMKDHGGISFGKSWTFASNDYVANHTSGITSSRVATVARVTNISAQYADIQATIQKAVDNGIIKDYGTLTTLQLMDSREGSASMSGYLYDYVFDRRTSEQRIAIDDRITDPIDAGQYYRKKHMDAAPKIRMVEGKDGASSLQFRYSKGSYVRRGETIAYRDNTFRAEPEAIAAKDTGLMRYGFFNDEGMLVDEKSINDFLNQKNVRQQIEEQVAGRGEHISEDAARRRASYEILRKQYNEKLYVEASHINVQKKLAEGTEKNEANALLLGLGASNATTEIGIKNSKNLGWNETGERIAGVANDLGLGRGMLLSRERMEEFKAKDIADTSLGVLINGMRADKGMKALSHDGYKDILKKNGFESEEDFFKAAMEERMRPTEVMNEIYHKEGALRKDQYFQLLTGNQQAGALKHNDVTIYNLLANNLFDKYGNEAEKEIEKRRKHAEQLGKVLDTTEAARIRKEHQEKVFELMKSIMPKDYGMKLEVSGNSPKIVLTDRHYGEENKFAINMSKAFDLAKQEFGENSGIYQTLKTSNDTTSPITGKAAKSVTYQTEVTELQDVERPTFGIEGVPGADHGLKVNFRHQANILNIVGGKLRGYDENGNLHVLDGSHGEEATELGRVYKGIKDSYLAENMTEAAATKATDKIFAAYLDRKATDQYDENHHLSYKAVQGEAIGKGLADQITEAKYYRLNDKKLAYADLKDPDSSKNEIVSRVDEDALKKFEKEEGFSLPNWEVNGKNVADQQIRGLIETAQSKGIRNVGSSAIRDQMQAMHYSAAQNFNVGTSRTVDKKYLEKMGFQTISLENLMADPSANPSLKNSMFGKSFILDLKTSATGDALYGGDESKRYVAFGFTPASFAHDEQYLFDQNLTPYQSSLRQLKERWQDFVDGIHSEKGRDRLVGEDRENAINGMRLILQKAVQAQAKQLNGKGGVLAKASSGVMGDSVRLTSHSFDIGGSAVNADKKTAGMLDNMSFEGHNLAKENAKGAKALKFDISVQGFDIADELYTPKLQNLAKQFGMSEEQLSAFQGKLYDHLETNGVDAINLREPMQYRGSYAPTKLYYSHQVKGDETYHVRLGQELKKEDNDSDKTVMKTNDYEAVLEMNGKKRVVNIDSAMYDVLKQQKGIKVQLSEAGMRAYNDTRAYQYYMASSLTKAYDSPEKPLEDNVMGEKSAGEFTDTGSVGGRNTGRMTGLTAKQKRQMDKDYNALLDAAKLEYNASKNDSTAFDALDEGAKRHYAALQVDKLAGTTDPSVEYSTEALQTRNRYQMATAWHVQKTMQNKTLDAFTGKAGAGMVNYQTQRALQVIQESHAYNDKQLSDAFQVFTALQETYLSAKNNKAKTGGEDAGSAEKLKNLSDAFQGVYSVMQKPDATQQERKDVSSNLFNVIWKATMVDDDRTSKEFGKLMGWGKIHGKNEAETRQLQEARVKEAISTVSNMAQHLSMHGSNMWTLMAGITRGSEHSAEHEISHMEGSHTLQQETLADISETTKRLYGESAIGETAGIKADTAYAEKLQLQEARRKEALALKNAREEKEVSREALDDSKQARKKLMRSMKKAHVPGGKAGILMGVAGGLMLSGYVSDPSEAPKAAPVAPSMLTSGVANDPASSRPATPADDQASMAAQTQAAMYPDAPVNLADSNLDVMRGAATPSYVVNINAQSPQGESAAQGAAQNAALNALPPSSMINMSVSTSYADKLSQLQLGQMVRHMLN